MVNTSRRPVEERLWEKVLPTGFCWYWTAGATRGYGVISLGGRYGKQVYAHRLAYELLVGPIPEGAQLDHLCRNSLCVNPDHLEPVTQRENLRRGFPGHSGKRWKGGMDVCYKGHPLDYVRRDGKGRMCTTCKNARRRAAYRASHP